jgi:hypothetical protein
VCISTDDSTLNISFIINRNIVFCLLALGCCLDLGFQTNGWLELRKLDIFWNSAKNCNCTMLICYCTSYSHNEALIYSKITIKIVIYFQRLLICRLNIVDRLRV